MKVESVWFKDALLIPRWPRLSNKKIKKELDYEKKELIKLLKKHRFISFSNFSTIYYDNELACLWLLYGFKADATDMFRYVSKLKLKSFHHWEIPSLEMVNTISKETLFVNHPKLKDGVIYSSTPNDDNTGYRTAFLGKDKEGVADSLQTIIPIHKIAQRNLFEFIIANSLIPNNVDGVDEKLNKVYALLQAVPSDGRKLPALSTKELKNSLLNGDHIRANLPKLESSILTDMAKGLWELYQPKEPVGKGWIKVDLDEPWEARNPELDINSGAVGIDFGTSSTVVAVRNQGKISLLRVGMSDFFKKPQASDYENPTVLEFVNLPNLLSVWQSDNYRPLTKWEDFHFSHEALNRFRENEANQDIVSSILTDIKQCLTQISEKNPLRIIDQMTQTEMDIPSIETVMPQSGQPLTVSEFASFDPIELYAYYLGLYINTRTNGLFLDYYMTFPVTYAQEIKDKIRASFARGLQRSLPVALVSSPHFSDFSVTEEASEPAAYAACALDELSIKPTKKGVAFAVFDFGGGTTDFDFGIFRLPSEQEVEEGYEKIIQNIGASGATNLGGENLIANLVYLVFRQNLDLCREHRIPFICPLGGELFPGHEPLVDNTYMAQTNSTLLMSKVRSIWENFKWEVERDDVSGSKGKKQRRQSDVIGDVLHQVIQDPNFNIDPNVQSCLTGEQVQSLSIEFLNRDKEKVNISFNIDINPLNHYLVKRVGQGVYRFFVAMKKAFNDYQISSDDVHVLLAGNSCHSILVQSVFVTLLQDKMMGWKKPVGGHHASDNSVISGLSKNIMPATYIVHRPPKNDETDLYKPSAKTGVAIGLLKLIPGETMFATGFHNQSDVTCFRYYVGGLKKNYFVPKILQNGSYHQWIELGKPIRGVFIVYFSDSPNALLGELLRGEKELQEIKIRLPSSCASNLNAFARITGPEVIDVFFAESIEQMQDHPEKIAHSVEIYFG
ncbi:MAG: hypothetical protein HN826_00475 [Methylococcales bacterium]|jgi:hypothetical protein|nr:hypothetical protein [Methylococcales bacterium]